MHIHPAVIVHGRADVDAVMALGRPVTLLSAPGAGVYGGCLWWRALVDHARATFEGTDRPTFMIDILDCADASGLALGALRCGVSRFVLWPQAPGRAAVASVAEAQGGFVLPHAPEALNMAAPTARRRLPDWLVSDRREARMPFGA
jgi:hypothetical protein